MPGCVKHGLGESPDGPCHHKQVDGIEQGSAAQGTPAQSLKTCTLSRPLPIRGANLAGRIEVGLQREAGPMEGVQDRTLWAVSIVAEPFAVLRVDCHDGRRLWLSPDTWSWVE